MKKRYEYRNSCAKRVGARSLMFTKLAKKKTATKAEGRQNTSYIVTWGENKIEISSQPKGHIIVYNASANLPISRVGKRMRQLAEILKKSHNAHLRRLGYDILEEHYEEAAV